MTDSFIVAGLMDDVFEQLVADAIREIKENPADFEPVIYENIACYYAMKNDLENTIKYLEEAKKYSHPNFQSIKDLHFFKDYMTDKKFTKLFK